MLTVMQKSRHSRGISCADFIQGSSLDSFSKGGYMIRLLKQKQSQVMVHPFSEHTEGIQTN